MTTSLQSGLAASRTSRFDVVAEGRLVDAVRGEAPVGRVQLDVDAPGLTTKLVAGGWFCVAGKLHQALPHLDTTEAAFHLLVEGDAYRPARHRLVVPVGAGLPVSAGEVPLHPRPVALSGRVVEEAGTRPPVADALVRLVADPALGGGAATQPLLLRSPLGFDHVAGTPIHLGEITAAGAPRVVGHPARSGSRRIVLDDRAGIVDGTLLQLGGPSRRQYVRVDGVPTSPSGGTVFLKTPLSRGVAAGEPVAPVSFGSVSAAAALAADAHASDGVLLTDTWFAEGVIEIADPDAERLEYVDLGVLSGSDGAYRATIGRIPVAWLEAWKPGFTSPEPAAWTVPYGAAPGPLDFRLLP